MATKKELEILLKDNCYVKGITNDCGIMYTDEFYRKLNEKLESGTNSLEAYAALGFDVDVLGENRAYAACKRAKQKVVTAKKQIKYVCGTKPMSEMGQMTPEEELAYLRSRVHVLENMLECKKNAQIFIRWHFHLRRKKNRILLLNGIL